MQIAGVELGDFHHLIPGFSASVSMLDAFALDPQSVSRVTAPISIYPPEFGAKDSTEISSVLKSVRDRYDADAFEETFKGMHSYLSVHDWWKAEKTTTQKSSCSGWMALWIGN